MKTFLDCIPCLVRQTQEAVFFATDDEALRESLVREVLRLLAEIDLHRPPPHIAPLIHRLIRERTGCADPYREMKDRMNREALALYPLAKKLVQSAEDPFDLAVRLAIGGNIFDSAAKGHGIAGDASDLLARARATPIFGETPARLGEAIRNAKQILVLGDNAGEIVFDKLLLEVIKPSKCLYVVRGGPTINDATIEDARRVGLTEITEVIENGSDAPGTILEACSPAFVERFWKADLVISKGQGNYETLNEIAHPHLFFLLRAKCPVVAQHLGCNMGDFVIHRRA